MGVKPPTPSEDSMDTMRPTITRQKLSGTWWYVVEAPQGATLGFTTMDAAQAAVVAWMEARAEDTK